MTRIVLGLAVAALVLTACQKPADKPVTAREIAAGQALADAKAKAAAGAPSMGVTQITSSGSPRGYGLKLPPPHIDLDKSGRTATITLPFRTSDNLAWRIQTLSGPWKIATSTVTPKGGPEGTDQAQYIVQASGPGSGVIAFELASPAGAVAAKAPQDHVMTYQATVIAP